MNSEKEKLIIDLRRIIDNEYNLKDGEKAADYLELMLKYIGDTDPELRDELIYMTFVYWIEEKKYFSNEELCDLLDTLMSEDYMFYNMGSEGDDSVFRRSFSVLLINPILCVHKFQEAFLDEKTLLRIKDSLIRFYNEEKDLRGYDNEKGWAHALAHAADGITILLVCEGITEEICKEVLACTEKKLFEGRYPLTADEDERIINGIYGAIIDDELLSEEYICNWIEGLSKVLDIEDRMIRSRARVNTKNFIRSLYFRMLHNEKNGEILKSALNTEKKINVYLD